MCSPRFKGLFIINILIKKIKSTLTLINPVEKLLNDIESLEHELEHKSQDFIFGCFTQEARDRIMRELNVLKLKKLALEEKLPVIQSFYSDYVDIRAGTKIKYVKTEDSYKYFNRVLKDYEFQYAPVGATCDFCSKTKSKRTGIVFTFDPLTADLVYICDYCHIDRAQQKNREKNIK